MKKKTLFTVISTTTAIILVSGAVVLRIAHVSGDPEKASALASVPGLSDVEKGYGDYTYIPPVPADQTPKEDPSEAKTEP